MRVFRKYVLTALVMAGLTAQGLAVAQTAAQKQEDTLIYLHSIEPKSLFQWWTQATYPKRNVLDSLVYLDENNQLHPWLAKSWSQDGTVWTFKLRDDVVFTDGTKLDAATVAKNFDFWLKLTTSVPDSYFKEAKVIDEHTVEFHTTVAQPYLADTIRTTACALATGICSAPSSLRTNKPIQQHAKNNCKRFSSKSAIRLWRLVFTPLPTTWPDSLRWTV